MTQLRPILYKPNREIRPESNHCVDIIFILFIYYAFYEWFPFLCLQNSKHSDNKIMQ